MSKVFMCVTQLGLNVHNSIVIQEKNVPCAIESGYVLHWLCDIVSDKCLARFVISMEDYTYNV